LEYSGIFVRDPGCKVGREPDKLNISACQRKVVEFLSNLGLVVEVEKNIGSYRVDIFLPELKTVVEVDGPFMYHSERREEKRDEELERLGVERVEHVTGLAKGKLEALARRLGYEGD